VKGVPHMSTAEDIHDGYYMPKGTFIVASLWSVIVLFHIANALIRLPVRYRETSVLSCLWPGFWTTRKRLDCRSK